MFFTPQDIRQKQSGYTLVEIMVAMVITLIVMGGVYKTFTSESVNTEKEQMRIDMQMSGRVILDLISRDIRAAGFEGCGGTLAANTLSNKGATDVLQTYTTTGTAASLPILTTMKGAAGIQYLGMPFAYINDDSVGTNIYRDGTDVLTLQYVSKETSVSTAMAATTTDPIVLTSNSFKNGDILVISDCEHYSIFQKTNSDDTLSIAHLDCNSCVNDNNDDSLNTDSDLSHAYDTTAKVYKLKINTYFIDDTTLDLSLNATQFDIAENIEDLQFQYLYDTDNDNDLTDETWTDTIAAGFTTSDVAAIRIFVLLRSDFEASGHTNTDTYDYPNSLYYSAANPFGSANGAGGAPGDGYYRSLLSTIVYMRNYNL
ncbi:MAG: PilW family protein [Desulfobulbaceae bacterium]|nr:PilW family protein [Desulfobulbaceae bacterium]